MINPTFNQSNAPTPNNAAANATPTSPSARPGSSPTPGSFAQWPDEAPSTQPNNSKAILIGAVIVAGALFAIGFMTRGGAQPAQANAAPVQNYFTEQQKMMREAMDMARHAQQAHREHMDLMRQQMAESMEGPSGLEADSGTNSDF